MDDDGGWVTAECGGIRIMAAVEKMSGRSKLQYRPRIASFFWVFSLRIQRFNFSLFNPPR